MADSSLGGALGGATRSSGETLLFLTDDQLRRGIEAMFFAYRGFTADPDRILAEKSYGRAHHRAIHFIHRTPGTTVNNLLDILGVTKQSLNRVLRTLIEDGLVQSKVGVKDRRERHLNLTEAGKSSERGAAQTNARGLPGGRARGGCRVPTGVATDYGSKDAHAF